MSAAVPQRRLLLCLLLAAPALPAAALEKCVSPAGKVTYSEQACPPGSKASTVPGTAPIAAPPAAPSAATQDRPAKGGAQPATAGGKASTTKSPAKPKPTLKMAGQRDGAQVDIRYFDVQGSDYESLMAALRKDGVHRGAEWSLTYKYDPRRSGKACSVASLDTTLKQTITLPRWAYPRDASPKLVAEWTRYVGALKKHQEGHLGIARDMHEAFRDSLAVTHARCDQLEASIKSQYKTLLERYKALEKEYDFETAQGRTEGVEFVQR
jgi:predicted secreted Zn-dependent protease